MCLNRSKNRIQLNANRHSLSLSIDEYDPNQLFIPENIDSSLISQFDCHQSPIDAFGGDEQCSAQISCQRINSAFPESSGSDKIIPNTESPASIDSQSMQCLTETKFLNRAVSSLRQRSSFFKHRKSSKTKDVGDGLRSMYLSKSLPFLNKFINTLDRRKQFEDPLTKPSTKHNVLHILGYQKQNVCPDIGRTTRESNLPENSRNFSNGSFQCLEQSYGNVQHAKVKCDNLESFHVPSTKRNDKDSIHLGNQNLGDIPELNWGLSMINKSRYGMIGINVTTGPLDLPQPVSSPFVLGQNIDNASELLIAFPTCRESKHKGRSMSSSSHSAKYFPYICEKLNLRETVSFQNKGSDSSHMDEKVKTLRAKDDNTQNIGIRREMTVVDILRAK